MPLKNKVAIVTGGNSGIGLVDAAVERFGLAGAKDFSTLVVLGRGINHRQRHLDCAVVKAQLRQFARLRQLVTPLAVPANTGSPDLIAVRSAR